MRVIDPDGQKILRPLIWGFFVSAGIGAAAWWWGTRAVGNAEDQWNNLRTVEIEERERVIAADFGAEVERLLRTAKQIAADATIRHKSGKETPKDVAEMFRRLAELRGSGSMTIDIVDPRGVIVAWAGKSLVSEYRQIFEGERPDSFAILTSSDLHSYLSVAQVLSNGQLYAIVSKPFEMRDLPSTGTHRSDSFVERLSARLGVTVRLVPAGRIPEGNGFTLVPLSGFSGEVLGHLAVPEPSREEYLDRVGSSSQQASQSAFALSILFASSLIGFITWRQGGWIAYTAVVLLVWVIRYAWIGLDFPGGGNGGWLFDPALYASPFGFGLASSLGDTLISAVALAISVLVLLRFLWDYKERMSTYLHGAGKPVVIIVLVALSIASCFVLRAYAASARSFVFDSTLALYDPATVFPSLPVSTMYLIFLIFSLVSAAVILVLVLLITQLAEFIASDHFRRLAVSAFSLVAGLSLFLIVDRLDLVDPIVVSCVLLGTLAIVSLRRTRYWTSVAFSFLAVSSFILSVLTVDRMLHAKERVEYEQLASGFLRPADAWFNVVVDDALKEAQSAFRLSFHEGMFENRKLAFTLWTSTMLRQSGHNSAFVVYDQEGIEVSRFSVGMASYEQNEMLYRVFDLDEESVQILEREIGPAMVKYYGEWGTLRDSENTLRGYIAALLSVSQGLEVGAAAGPFQVAKDRPPFRKVFLTTYEGNQVTSTTHPALAVGESLPERAERLLSASKGNLWLEEDIGGEESQSLYAREPAQSNLVLRMSIEQLDLRWHLFNSLKLTTIYFIAFTIAGFALWAADTRKKGGRIRLGFREKLVLTILFAVVAPIVVLGYYNRRLANERSEEILVSELQRQLSLIGRRIDHAVQTEEDFIYGMTDDFCSSIARDVGIDFSIFRNHHLLASSRRDLYDATILDARLQESAYTSVVLMGKDLHISFDRYDDVDYANGYRPIRFGSRTLGTLSVSTLSRQHEVERELMERNAFTIGIHAIVLILTIGIGLAVAHRLSQPLRSLQRGAKEVGRGNLTTSLSASSDDEIGDLIVSFNEMTEQLRRNREELARVERELAWKEMAKQVAHEIKNPLTPIRLSIQHLRQAFHDRSKDIEEIVQKVTSTILEQIDALARIATEFSNFSRMPEPRYERVDLHQLIEEAVHLFHGVRDVEFRLKFSDTKPLIIADKDELRRVLVNILRNSLQAMSETGRVEIHTSAADGVCTLRISDTGGGIPADLREKVFQPSFSTKTEGMGLGLAISRKIIEDLNGSISLTSEVGKGTSVIIKLPYQQ
jgi:signal transduction histidine kinase